MLVDENYSITDCPKNHFFPDEHTQEYLRCEQRLFFNFLTRGGIILRDIFNMV